MSSLSDYYVDNAARYKYDDQHPEITSLMRDNMPRKAKSVDDTVSLVDHDVRDEMFKRQRDRLMKEKMELVDGFGEDTYDNGTVVKFLKKFAGMPYKPDGYKEDKAYDYAAIKGDDGKWYTTGPSAQKGFTWEELVTWLVSGKFPTKEFSVMSVVSK